MAAAPKFNPPAEFADQKRKPKCGRCGYSHGEECPAMGETCRKCGGRDHFARRCKTKRVHELEEEDSGRVFFMGSLSAEDEEDEEPPWNVQLLMNGTPVTLKFDSGADVTVIDMATYQKLKQRPALMKTDAKLQSLKSRLDVAGKFHTTVTYHNQEYSFDVYVIEGTSSNVLSRAVCKKMGIIQCSLAEVAKPQVGLWKTEPVKIRLKDDAEPYQITAPRRVPLALKPKIEAELQPVLLSRLPSRLSGVPQW